MSKEEESTADVVVSAIARWIFSLRWLIVIFWVVATVAMLPCAYWTLLRSSPMTKHAPGGTESSEAMGVFESHFPNLAILRREMVVFKCKSYCKDGPDNTLTKGYVQQVVDLIKQYDNVNQGDVTQLYSYYDFTSNQFASNPMQAKDGQSILVQWVWRVPPDKKPTAEAFAQRMQAKIDEINKLQEPQVLEVAATGFVFLDHALKETLIEEIPVHEFQTIWAPFTILALTLGSARMLLLALIPMGIEIPVAFGIMYFVSLHTTVLQYGLMMMLMLCTSLSFDYALFTLTRYAEERAAGEELEEAIVTVISQSGRVVVISGIVLVIAWAAMLGLPSPFDGFAIASASMIIVCVLVQLTFTPALLAILPILGPPKSDKPSRLSDSKEVEAMLKVEDMSPRSDIDRVFAEAKAKAEPHERSLWYKMGGVITMFPVNIILPLIIYAIMSPLTMRMSKNFDWSQFKFKMGHSYELTEPRTCHEWKTLLQIQQDFPSQAGTLMPMLIIATNVLPETQTKAPLELPKLVSGNVTSYINDAQEAFRSYGEQTLNASLQWPTTPAPMDVRHQSFFDANCNMVNKLITASKGKPYELDADSFLSTTFHGKNAQDGGVQCLQYSQIHFVTSSFLIQKVFMQHTSAQLQDLWDQLVSQQNHAMLTFVFPKSDPFSPDAFELATLMRDVLKNETTAGNAEIPGLTFLTFSPGSVMMDLIEVTSKQLPLCFAACAVVCLLFVAGWFGALFIPFKLLLTVVVPITWTFGAGLYVYEDGLLQSWGVTYPGLIPTGDAGIDWTVPMFSLTFMMGLALDYEIFLFERIREFRLEGFSDNKSIQLGLAATGGTISAAGLIMALTFTSQLLGSVPVTNQLGFILVFSIVVDTFVVRSILVPAMLSILPASNYWPAKMPKVVESSSDSSFFSDSGGGTSESD
eukprot:TRINITY_DN573_c0_g1_i1.p1 TRINITY_DN573_c0_g1~~TRINITY_DN573_c0_g1_i1.p1  ORF type:complete len:942 (+),score=175.16 TRINITY_DN573_c0_g1_i1:64-2826(+)